jgi:hypothetical protein
MKGVTGTDSELSFVLLMETLYKLVPYSYHLMASDPHTYMYIVCTTASTKSIIMELL